MSEKYMSIIALVIAVFFSGFYLKGEQERKAEIMREIDLIRERQEEVKARVEAINSELSGKDSVLVDKIRRADSFIVQLSKKDSLETAEIEMLSAQIQQEKEEAAQILAAVQGGNGFTLKSSVEGDSTDIE